MLLLGMMYPWLAIAQKSARREARALWVSRFDYGSAADIEAVMRSAESAHFNIVYFQARAAADAYYRSDLEPCAARLCGRLGGAPPYDPLLTAVESAHAHGLQLHAWLNALTGLEAGNGRTCAVLGTASDSGPTHILTEHPEWAMLDQAGRALPCPNSEEYVWLSPGHQEVRSRLAAVAADIARRYSVDGIHLDRIRYPGTAWSYDSASLAAFADDPQRSPGAWAAFRSALVQSTVRETFDSVMAVNPRLVLSAAVWGVYTDRWHWKTLGGRSDLFQDPRAWAADHIIDVVVPMTYVRVKKHRCDRADWRCLVDDHIAGIQHTSHHPVYAGIDASLGAAEVVKQVKLARRAGAAGISIFSYGAIAEQPGLWRALREGVFARPAQPPSIASVQRRLLASAP